MSVLSFVRSSSRVLSVVLVAQGAVACATGVAADGGAGGSASTTASTSTVTSTADASSSSSKSASTGTAPTSCVPMVGATVGPDCGVFVKEGPMGEGTLAKPFNAIRTAIAGGAKRIYVCTGTYYDAFDLPLGVEIFGAIDCKSDWLWRPSPTIDERSHVIGEPGAATVRVHGDGALQARVFGLRIEAPAAVTPGDSSIAVLAEGGIVRFDYVQFLAGTGANGSAGVEMAEPAMAGEPGGNGTWDISGGPFDGGAGVVHTLCPAVKSGTGGPGGNFNVNGGFPLSAGTASVSPLGGGGGLADHDIGDCGTGGNGLDAAPAEAGAGGDGKGSFDGGRFFGASGARGLGAPPGGAGGGGGGNAAFTCGTQSGWCPGASGGGGGTGGCGGAGGEGGQAGGSSFGLVSLGATIEVAFSSFAVSRGGVGGAGAEGQLGGEGGLGGLGWGGGFGVPKACDGGIGGIGGQGGAGGGGSGGHAIAIAFTGTAPTQNQVVFSLPAVNAAGGAGVNPGADGLVENTLQF